MTIASYHRSCSSEGDHTGCVQCGQGSGELSLNSVHQTAQAGPIRLSQNPCSFHYTIVFLWASYTAHNQQSYGFSSSHVWMWELDCKESWVLKNWCFWTVVLEKTLESPLDCKEIQPVHPRGDQAWVFIGRTDAEAETPILWPPHAKSWLIGKDSDAGRDWGQE